MRKLIAGLSSVEREQADYLNKVNECEHESIPAEKWGSMSACAILGHLVEAIGKEDIQFLLDQMEEG